jgi:hypothetical protein
MLAPLVTFVCDVPLKRKILFHLTLPRFTNFPADLHLPGFVKKSCYYLSPAPHPVPQAAAGASSVSSEAPHPVPQAAAGVSSVLSEAPQAVPHAAAGVSSAFFVHPNKFESAMVCNLLILIYSAGFPTLCDSYYNKTILFYKYALFCNLLFCFLFVQKLYCFSLLILIQSFQNVTFHFKALEGYHENKG